MSTIWDVKLKQKIAEWATMQSTNEVMVAVVQPHPLVDVITIKFTDGAVLSIPFDDLALPENSGLDFWIREAIAHGAKYFLRNQIPPILIPACLSEYLFTHPASPKATYRPAAPKPIKRPKRLIRI